MPNTTPESVSLATDLYTLERSFAVSIRRCQELRARQESLESRINSLLAVIHRDGGHHTITVGIEQSCIDAMGKVAEMLTHESPEDSRAATGLPGPGTPIRSAHTGQVTGYAGPWQLGWTAAAAIPADWRLSMPEIRRAIEATKVDEFASHERREAAFVQACADAATSKTAVRVLEWALINLGDCGGRGVCKSFVPGAGPDHCIYTYDGECPASTCEPIRNKLDALTGSK